MTGSSQSPLRSSAILTLLIADIRGWTAFTAEHGDEAASRLAQKFAEICREGIEAWGGRLIELRGDEALGAFESARDALRAATELQAAFAAETQIDPALPLRIGIGLDVGEVVAVGDGYRGAALNVAARLCATAEAGAVIATQNVTHLAGRLPGTRYEPIEPLKLKGISDPVSASRVLGEVEGAAAQVLPDVSDQPTPLDPELDPVVPLAGREMELRWLLWHWRRAGHGAGRCVVIFGPPGIGKTRLTAELARTVAASGATVIYRPSTAVEPVPALSDTDGRTLLVFDDVDSAPYEVGRALSALAPTLGGRHALLIVTHRAEASTSVLGLAERLAPAQQRRQLGPLERDAVRTITALYAGRAIDRMPLDEIVKRSAGVPATVHRWASALAREVAVSRLQATAERTASQRRSLRSIETELVDDVTDVEVVRESTELYVAPAAEDGGALPSRRLDVCPYKGLASFEAVDAEYYFGRERLVAELVARLVGSEFLSVVGASGSGKSSALRAGVLPALSAGVLPGSDSWRQIQMRPGDHPLTELENALDGVTVDAALRDLPPSGRLLLFIDQFEEIFNSTRDETERAEFIDLLTSDRERLKVVLAIRADHYGHCASYPRLARLLADNNVLVGQMTPVELRAAIEHPAHRVGLRVEPELTTALLADLADEPGALPLLSTALLELWQERSDGRLTHAAYRTRGGVEGAVARLAESAYAKLSDEEQSLARSIFLRLAGPGEGEGVVRRRVALSEFDPENNPTAAAVLDRLTDARLLTTGDGYVEVAHEALLREWPRLRGWLDEDAAGRQLRLHLIDAARDWETRERQPEDLYRGARLVAALDWSTDHLTELNALEQEFLAQSRLAAERETVRQRATNRRLRLLLAGAAVFLIVAIGAGAYAAYQTQLARAAEEFARSRELAASGIATVDDDPTLSKLLAISAASIADPPVESVAALHRAWDADRVVYRFTMPADHPVGFVAADIDPAGDLIGTSCNIFGNPHSYVDVVDRNSGQQLWSVASADPVALGHALFTPDGSRVVFGAFVEGTTADSAAGLPPMAGIHVRDARTGAEVGRIDVGPCGAALIGASNSTALVFTPNDSSCIPLGFHGGHRRLAIESVDLASGARTVLSSKAWGNDENGVSADGQLVAWMDIKVSDDPNEQDQPKAIAYNLATGTRIEMPTEAGEFVGVHDVSADGTIVLLDYRDELAIWDPATNEIVNSFAPDPATHDRYAQFAPDGQTVFSTGGDGRLHEWSVEHGDELLAYSAPQGRPAVGSNGLVIVPASDGPTALLIDTSFRAEIKAIEADAIISATVPDAFCLVSLPGGALDIAGRYVGLTYACTPTEEGARFDTMTLLDRDSFEPALSIGGGYGQLLSPDGARLLQGMGNEDADGNVHVGGIRIVDASTGNRLVDLEGLCSFERNEDSPTVLRQARRDHANPGCVEFPERPFPMDSRPIHGLRWSPDGRFVLAVDGLDHYFAVWRADDGRLVEEALAANDLGLGAFDAAFTADSAHLIVSFTSVNRSGVPSHVLRSFSTTTWQLEQTRELGDRVSELTLVGTTTGANMIGVSGYQSEHDRALYWFAIPTLEDALTSRPRVHDAILSATAMSSDGELLATGAVDGLVRVWSTTDGSLVHEVAFPDEVFGVGFMSPDHLGVVLADGNLRVITLDTAELLNLTRESLTRGFTDAECDRFGFDPCPTLDQIRSGDFVP